MKEKKTNSMRGTALLLITALIWGTAFVAQSESMNHVGVFTFIGCRYLLGGAVLVPVFFGFRRFKRAEYAQMGKGEVRKLTKTGLLGGVCCGVCLFVASSLQQIGIVYTSVGKAGFLTALYIVLVPLLGLFLKRTVGVNVWVSVAIAVVGMYLLCINEQFSIGRGDIYVLLCAVGFSVYILVVDHFSDKAESILMSSTQFFTAGVLGCVAMFFAEQPTWEAILAAGVSILYAGVLSSGVAYTLEMVAQKELEPTIASLLMSLEAVFALISGWLLLGQTLSARELMGCALVMAAVILVQLPEDMFRKKVRA